MLPRNKKLINTARNLRKNMTKQEKHLWYDFLSGYPIKFTRQKIIGNYIADFYCEKARLIVELDGSQHYRDVDVEYDRLRTDYFNMLGIQVIRFSNKNCNEHFEGICQEIDKVVINNLK